MDKYYYVVLKTPVCMWSILLNKITPFQFIRLNEMKNVSVIYSEEIGEKEYYEGLNTFGSGPFGHIDC